MEKYAFLNEHTLLVGAAVIRMFAMSCVALLL